METPCKLFESPQGSQRSQQQQSARPQWKQRWSAIALGELGSILSIRLNPKLTIPMKITDNSLIMMLILVMSG